VLPQPRSESSASYPKGTEKVKDQEFYYDLKGKHRESTFLLMLNCLLLTRAKNDLDEKENRFEEEVNVYLANLLTAFSEPSYIERLRPYLSEHDLEVFRRLRHSNDARLKYTIYKANADFLLFSIGLFDAAGEASVPLGPEFKHGHQGQMGRGQTYYHFAFSYSQRVPGLGSTITEVLEQLSKGFEKYVTILTYVRGEYFDIVKRLSDGEIYHLMRSVEATGKRERLERKQNEFLDAYADWMNHRTEEAKTRVILVAKELRAIDPSFTYKPA
jgi:hypothetical protein